MAEQTGFFQKVIDERDGGNAFGRMIGIKTVEVREGYCRMEMEIMPPHMHISLVVLFSSGFPQT